MIPSLIFITFVCSSLGIRKYDTELTYKLTNPITNLKIGHITESILNNNFHIDDISYNNDKINKELCEIKIYNLEQKSDVSSFVLKNNDIHINLLNNIKFNKEFICNDINFNIYFHKLFKND